LLLQCCMHALEDRHYASMLVTSAELTEKDSYKWNRVSTVNICMLLNVTLVMCCCALQD